MSLKPRSTASVFQSMLPVRGATIRRRCYGESRYISIHAPRAGSDCEARPRYGLTAISIHAPRAGSDRRHLLPCDNIHYFNPCSPCGERRTQPYCSGTPEDISIHAPRAGSDQCTKGDMYEQTISIHAPRAGSDDTHQELRPRRPDFNPCSPCGERLTTSSALLDRLIFQSMLPVRGATAGKAGVNIRLIQFQSMLPVRGATAKSDKIRVVFWQNSRSFR